MDKHRTRAVAERLSIVTYRTKEEYEDILEKAIRDAIYEDRNDRSDDLAAVYTVGFKDGRSDRLASNLEKMADKMPSAKDTMPLSFDLWTRRWSFNIPKPKTSGTAYYGHTPNDAVDKAMKMGE